MTDPQVRKRIVHMRTKEGLSLRQIGLQVGLSGERVRQVLEQEGIKFEWTIKPPTVPKILVPLDAKAVLRKYGCSIKQLNAIQGNRLLADHFSPAFVYQQQRFRYFATPGWTFTLPDWWKLWKPYWARRLPDNLVLMPVDRSQPVSAANVLILTRSEVMKRYWRERQK